MTALSTGALLDDFRVEHELGRGGMGVVYRATQVSLDRPVALKVVAPQLAGRAEFRDRFVRESRLAASLDHPNVIPLYAAGEADGVLYIAMRCVDGTDLRTLISREGALDATRVAAIAAQLASALEAAHERGLVHRDVKPGNVLVSPRRGGEHVYLTDFGLTKRAASDSGLTASGEWVGTLDYVAPEQVRGDSVDGRADIYSLGCVMYEALTADVPFPRENELAKLWAHIADAPPLATDLAPHTPPGLAEAARRAMAKNPDDRFATAAELGRAALAAVPDAATRARPVQSGRDDASGDAAAAPTRRLRAGGRNAAIARPGRRALIVLAAVAAVALAAAVFTLARDGSDGPSHAPAVPAGMVTGPPLRVGDSPSALAAGAGSLWVANTGDETVSRIDPRSGEVVGRPIPVGEDPSAIAVGAGVVWVANAGDGTVTRIDLRSGRPLGEPIAVGRAPTDLLVGRGYLWVATELDRVVKVNASTGRLAGAPIRVKSGGPLALAGDFLWVGDQLDGTLRAVSTRTSELVGAPIAIGRGPTDIVAGPDGLWVTLAGEGAVKRVVSRGGRRSFRTIRTGGRPEYLALRRGVLWVTDRDRESVIPIYAASAARAEPRVHVPDDPAGIALAAGRVWVSSSVTDRVTRIDPR